MASDEHPDHRLMMIRREAKVTTPAGPATTAAAGAQPRTAVMVHGSMDRATSFTRVMARLPDWTVVAYDRRGYAGSAGLGPPQNFDQQVSDLLDVLGDNRVEVVFGHSFGGNVVLAAASRRPDLIPAAMVWEAPQPWLQWWPTTAASRGAGEDLAPEDRAEWFMRRMIGDRVWERLPSTTRALRRSEGPTLEAELGSLTDRPAFRASDVRIPVVVGRGGESSPHHRRGARELAGALPLGELDEIPDAGHGAHLTHPGELAALIRRAAERA